MRRLIASTMVSLDGVLQAPGGPEEDPTAGFALGGWSFPFWDDAPDRDMRGLDGKDRELRRSSDPARVRHVEVDLFHPSWFG
jgi:hypothetical protein